jgi:hypothetical protein
MTLAPRLLRSRQLIHRRKPVNLAAADAELFNPWYDYSTYDCFLDQIPNARVTADSVIYRNFRLLDKYLYRAGDRGYYRFRYLAKTLLRSRRVRLNRGTKYLLATDQESSGHFHWLTEVLPRLWLVRDVAGEFVLMLPDTGYMRSRAVESLAAVGLEFQDILWMDAASYYDVSELFRVTNISRTGQMDDDVMKELNKAFTGDGAGGNRRLYVSRASARFRKIVNESELVSLLESHGYEVISPDDWTIAEQVAAFRECTTLVGLHGAGMTNCLFMPPGGKVVELVKREPNHGYWHLADSVGHDYYYYYGVPDSELSLIGRGCNLTIPVDDFEQQILNVI